MWQTEKLFDIPEISDFPVISHYSKEEVNYLLEELKKMELDGNKESSDDEDVEDLHELLKAFRNGLQVCKDKDVEWVSFMH